MRYEETKMNKYTIDWKKYASLARQAAAEGTVLLENKNHVLPLQENQKISVFGRIQFDYYKSGTGSGGLVNTRYVVGILDALKEEKLILNEELMNTYEAWIANHPFDFGQGWAQEPWSQEEMPLTDEIMEKAAVFSDTALVIIGRTAGEDRDASAEKGSYLLTDSEEDMVLRACRSFSKVIVLLNVGSIIDMRWVERYQPSAVLYVWQGGMEGGHGVADVLMGRVNPCGKLSDTIAEDITDYPSTENFGGESGNFYAEDIYVGYRYFETFAKEKVRYPFGYGLSYTSFEVKPVSVERKNPADTAREGYADGTEQSGGAVQAGKAEIVLTAMVINTGETAGKEVVQVYVKAPQGKLGKPVRSLVAFAKTRELQPGESQELTFAISDYTLASYDDSGLSGYRSAYVLEAGTYEFYLGSDVRSSVLAGSFDLAETRVVEQLTEAAAPAEAFSRLRPAISEACGGPAAQEPAEFSEDLLRSWEDVPLRTKTVADHIREDQTEALPYTGDQGYRLADVYDNKVSMDVFLSQLSDDDLCCMVNGEGMCSPKVTPGTAAAFGGVTEELAHFGIPCGCCSDGPSGIRMDCGMPAFSLPGGICLACTFNEELNEELFAMEGAELRKNRIDTLLGPGMNIHRNPLNGRNFEYFSEDPYLTGKLAAAQLRGMNRFGVTGTVKHFAGNNQEFHRKDYNTIVSERALREIYLKGFEIAVREGGAYSIMTTYGAVNGVWTAGNYDLLTIILRREWNYNGMVMTDWWADINEEGNAASQDQLSAMVKAQNDVFMVASDTRKHMGDLKEHLADGSLKRSVLVRSAANICRMLLRSPVMDRFLGRISREEKEAEEQMQAEDKIDFDLPYAEFEDYLELPTADICTDRGSQAMYGIKAERMGAFELHMTVKVDALDVAQVSVSAFVNGTLTGTLTLNGTGGAWVEVCLPLGDIRFTNSYIRLYFAQSGMKIAKMAVVRK